MTEQHSFQWCHYEADIILLCVRWYGRYPLSYRPSKQCCASEVGASITPPSIAHVQRYAPERDRRCRAHLKATTDSWRVDETDIQGKGTWMDLYRAVDSEGATLEVLLSTTRDAEAATRFFSKALGASHTTTPRVITLDKNAAYPKALTELKSVGAIPHLCELRQSK